MIQKQISTKDKIINKKTKKLFVNSIRIESISSLLLSSSKSIPFFSSSFNFILLILLFIISSEINGNTTLNFVLLFKLALSFLLLCRCFNHLNFRIIHLGQNIYENLNLIIASFHLGFNIHLKNLILFLT